MRTSTSCEPEDHTAKGLRNRTILLPLYHLVNQHYEQNLELPEPAFKVCNSQGTGFLGVLSRKPVVFGLRTGFSNLSPA